MASIISGIGNTIGGLLGRPTTSAPALVTVGIKPAVPATLLATVAVFATTQLVNLTRTRLSPTANMLISTVAGTIAGILAPPGNVAPKS